MLTYIHKSLHLPVPSLEGRQKGRDSLSFGLKYTECFLEDRNFVLSEKRVLSASAGHGDSREARPSTGFRLRARKMQ